MIVDDLDQRKIYTNIGTDFDIVIVTKLKQKASSMHLQDMYIQ